MVDLSSLGCFLGTVVCADIADVSESCLAPPFVLHRCVVGFVEGAWAASSCSVNKDTAASQGTTAVEASTLWSTTKLIVLDVHGHEPQH